MGDKAIAAEAIQSGALRRGFLPRGITWKPGPCARSRPQACPGHWLIKQRTWHYGFIARKVAISGHQHRLNLRPLHLSHQRQAEAVRLASCQNDIGEHEVD